MPWVECCRSQLNACLSVLSVYRPALLELRLGNPLRLARYTVRVATTDLPGAGASPGVASILVCLHGLGGRVGLQHRLPRPGWAPEALAATAASPGQNLGPALGFQAGGLDAFVVEDDAELAPLSAISIIPEYDAGTAAAADAAAVVAARAASAAASAAADGGSAGSSRTTANAVADASMAAAVEAAVAAAAAAGEVGAWAVEAVDVDESEAARVGGRGPGPGLACFPCRGCVGREGVTLMRADR